MIFPIVIWQVVRTINRLIKAFIPFKPTLKALVRVCVCIGWTETLVYAAATKLQTANVVQIMFLNIIEIGLGGVSLCCHGSNCLCLKNSIKQTVNYIQRYSLFCMSLLIKCNKTKKTCIILEGPKIEFISLWSISEFKDNLFIAVIYIMNHRYCLNLYHFLNYFIKNIDLSRTLYFPKIYTFDYLVVWSLTAPNCSTSAYSLLHLCNLKTIIKI